MFDPAAMELRGVKLHVCRNAGPRIRGALKRETRFVSDQWITVALEEYKTLREESLASLEQMQRTLQIGLVAIGVLTAFAIDAAKAGAAADVGLAISAPVVAALVVVLRLDELHRAVKAGAAIAVLEQRIALRIEEVSPGEADEVHPLTWESNVQTDFIRREDKIRHWAISILLLAAAAPAIALGLDHLLRNDQQEFVAVAAVVVLIVVGETCWYQRRVLNKVADMHIDARQRIGTIRLSRTLIRDWQLDPHRPPRLRRRLSRLRRRGRRGGVNP